MWQTICVLAEGLLHLICLVGLIAAILIVCAWCYAAHIMYLWMHQQSGHGIKWNKNKQIIDEDIYSNGLSPGSKNKSEHVVVKKSGVM